MNIWHQDSQPRRFHRVRKQDKADTASRSFRCCKNYDTPATQTRTKFSREAKLSVLHVRYLQYSVIQKSRFGDMWGAKRGHFQKLLQAKLMRSTIHKWQFVAYTCKLQCCIYKSDRQFFALIVHYYSYRNTALLIVKPISSLDTYKNYVRKCLSHLF